VQRATLQAIANVSVPRQQNAVGAVCGSYLTITTTDGKSASNVTVTGTFGTCDSLACGSTAVRVSDNIFAALAPETVPIFFAGTYTVQT